MDTNDYFRYPAKRPRLGEAPSGSQLRHPCIKSVESTGYLTSPLTQQGITVPTSYVVPKTEHFDSFDPGFSEFGREWMVSGPQPSIGAEWMIPSTGYYPNQPISTLHCQNYAGQIQLTYSEQSDVKMRPPPPTFPPPGLPHAIEHFPRITSAPPYPAHVPASLLNHELIQQSLDITDRLTSEAELRMTDESGYRTMEYLQLDVSVESENIGTETVCFGMVSS
jgi:hypothetical protein